jgi:hypothetical protein
MTKKREIKLLGKPEVKLGSELRRTIERDINLP